MDSDGRDGEKERELILLNTQFDFTIIPALYTQDLATLHSTLPSWKTGERKGERSIAGMWTSIFSFSSSFP